MNRLRLCRFGRLLCCSLSFCLPLSLNALEPPTPEQVRQYKADGTWAERVAKAKALGNNKADPALVLRTQARLQREAALAAGLPAPKETEGPNNAPPSGRNATLPAKGTVRVVVVLVDFPEYPHDPNKDTVEDIYSKFFGNGDPNYYPTESLHNFYSRSSYGQLDIQGNVLGWYRAPHDRGWYQGHDTGFPLYLDDGELQLVEDALNYYNGSHDFSQYDNNGDGYIDSLYLMWTGPDNGWSNFWWAKSMSWWHGFLYPHDGFEVDGKAINRYVWSWVRYWNDPNSIFEPSVDIHETGHQLGLPDLYDYDGNQGPDGGVGGLDMMDSNWGDHNSFSKYMLEWLTPTFVTSGSQLLTLRPAGTTPDCVLIMPNYSPNIFGEFFMAEYRKRGAGNDPWNYPSDGYSIWHIDSNLSGSNFAYDNSYTGHKLVRLMEADGQEDIENNRGASWTDFYAPGQAFGDFTFPNSRNYGGGATNVLIDQFTAPGTSMSARFSISTTPIIQSAGSSLVAESYQPANQTIDPGETVTVSLSLQNFGAAATSDLVATLQPLDGVTSPSAAQSYGAIPQLGVVTRSFSFVAGGDCGGKLTATLQLQDGATNYGLISFPLRIGRIPLEENFDTSMAADLPNGWTATAAAGQAPPWSLVYNYADTAPGAVHCPDPPYVSDNRLDSPAMVITSPNAQLTFRHAYDLDTDTDDQGNPRYWGGGVLEIAVGSSDFVDIFATGARALSGGYTGQLAGGYSNPLEGRWAWIGKTTGFITTTVALPSTLAGQTIRLRWRMGSDSWPSSFGGWWVDSVILRNLPTTEDFDLVAAPSLPSGWSTDVLVGAVAPWATSSAQSDTGPNSVYSPNPDFVAENSLTSASWPITSETLQLVFRHHYSFEAGYDGGTLEISIDGAPFTDILAAGGSFAAGGYTNVIPYGWDNPIAGRSAWSGESGGFVATVVNLPASAVGHTIRLRWLMGSDNAYGWGGWYIDSIALVNEMDCCVPLMEKAGAALVAEAYPPHNQVIDPQENVTVRFSLRNLGRNTTNLVATLLPTGGVVSPSGPQTYGATTSGGQAVSRDFSFIAAADCGSTITATLQLQDDATLFPPVTFVLPVGSVPLEESFDGVAVPSLPTGWTAAVATGNPPPWHTTFEAADTAFISAFTADPGVIAESSLFSPAIPIISSMTQLTFRQYYDFNAYYDALGNVTGAWDGGVLEISIASGPFTDIVTAGGSFVTGGYNNWIQGGYSNPIGNRWGWGGRSAGFTTTVVNLPAAAAGQTIQLRWRMGSDDSEPGLGWYVDSVSLRAVLASEYFDTVTAPALPSGWTATVATGPARPWATSQPADSAPNSAYSDDPAAVADNWMDSPALSIMSTTPQLAFRNYYELEADRDGGVLEISVGTSPFTDIVTAGGTFVTGGYNGTIPTGYGNPLAGRSAWTGNSGGFIDTVVNLPVAAVGSTIRLRWRMGSDSSGSSRGWFVDSVTLVGGCSMPVNTVGDFDGDGDVDQEDFGRLQACLTTQGQPLLDMRCEAGRMDTDTDVDQADLVLFKKCRTQPGTPANPNCRN